MPGDNRCAINGLTGGSAVRAIPVRRLSARPRPARAHPGIPGDCDRAAGLRPAASSRREPRACRQPGRPAGGGLGRADRLRIHHDQPYQCGAQGDRRQRRRTAPDPHHRPQGIPLRRRGEGKPIARGLDFTRSSGCDIDRHISGRAVPSGQALHRGLALPESERRSRAGLLRRWRGGRHHRGPVAHPLALRHRAQLELRLQGPARRFEAGRPRARRALCAGRQPAQGGEPRAHHGPAHRCDDRGAYLGRPLRRHPRRHLRAAGSADRERRGCDRAAARARGDRARQAQADGKPRRLRLLSARHGESASGNQGGHRRGAAPVLQGDRARSGFRLGLWDGGVVLFLAQGQWLDERSRAARSPRVPGWRAARSSWARTMPWP